ncbi:hypothetical protein EMIHUDRAFT_99142 [Emiliania huxleyi CCMP1516]|uniref:Ankyrin repeat protein n=2 Tax=Emiliania huxleyi TaxID=2903 RepID=A0A0D3K8U2_EMIH1|nr:hypothetical protein EMIHUDRAFT_99142 [Emiliania huxleyi CCMP1516]EOD32177.1 hypothetical protein EMIHUDRAFT_99142 [Emiliania huxleyi CCMP1516]|eukprot:XP_005784606.1 hypothetical protein EMIHUDRAFT_99142 [Emiliania huxleyi CCMP1516]
MRTYLEAGGDPHVADETGMTAFRAAVQRDEQGERDSRLLLLSFGVAVDASLERFIEAASRGDTEAVLNALRNGVDVHATNSYSVSALANAAMMGQTEIVKLLLEHGAGQQTAAAPIENVKPLLTAAGEAGHASVLAQLLEHKADPNAVITGSYAGSYGSRGTWETPLCAAAMGGHLDAVKVLVENGAEVNRPGKSGDTPYALARRHKEVREWLVINGAVAEGRKNKLDVGKFASLGLQLGAGPSQHVAESRDIGNLTSEVRGEQPTTFLPRRHGQERGSC